MGRAMNRCSAVLLAVLLIGCAARSQPATTAPPATDPPSDVEICAPWMLWPASGGAGIGLLIGAWPWSLVGAGVGAAIGYAACVIDGA